MKAKKSKEFKIGEIVVYPKHGVRRNNQNRIYGSFQHKNKILCC